MGTENRRPKEIEILLVEDSPTQAERLRYLMESKGYHTRVAANGRAALLALVDKTPDVVLSDVVMPEMDGYALCRAIKADWRWKDVPVILVTSLADPKDIVSGLECGADNFVRKPYADDYLLKRIDHVLMNQALRRDTGTGFEVGIALYVGGQRHVINARRQQTLDLLISTYEQAVAVNEELQARERQISDLNAKLARRATELELINAEIEHKNEELQHASTVKSEFVATVSHELRTPLNAIIGFSELLKDGLLGELGPQQKRPVETIFDSGKHLLGLINDILDLSRIEAGKLELELAPTDVGELLQDGMMMVNTRAAAHDIKLEVQAQPHGLALLDRRKVRQIVHNLLSNAVKFTPDGGAVSVRARIVPSAQWRGMQRVSETTLGEALSYLEISVADSGIGIAAEDIDRLFQPFVQLESGLSRKYEGSGLGLALVKQLVELHGGALALSSQPGAGSTFKVWLPFREP